MPQLQIVDETGGVYMFNLSEEEFIRASIDGFRWPDEAIKLLLAEYKQQEYLLNTGKVSVKKFWEIISHKLKEKSYNITGSQCKSKFNGLKKTFKSVKDYNNKSGNNKRSWSYFEIMNEMFGHKPWVTPVLTLDTSSSSIPCPLSPTCNSSSSSGTSPPSPPSPSIVCTSGRSQKRKRITQDQKVIQENALEKLLTIVQENKEERKKMHEETVARQDRLLTLLERIADKK